MKFLQKGSTIEVYWDRYYRWPIFAAWFHPRDFDLGLTVEFPSDWHDEKCTRLSLGFAIFTLILFVPWYRRYDDHHQCSGPTFGVALMNLGDWSELALWVYYGNDDGTPNGGRLKVLNGPWSWGRAVRHQKSSVFEEHPYEYRLRSGETQKRIAKVSYLEMEWRRWWLPWRRVWRGIDVQFDDEVGERSGSWKGGVTGCGYEMRGGETPRQCLRRMEREREF